MVFSIFIFVLGLVIGSFLNVCISRIPKGESIIFPASHCPECKNMLKPLELIPIFSFIFLKAKCRNCSSKISFRYPFIEFLTGAVFFILFLRFGISLNLICAVFLISVLIIVFFIDIDHLIIPDGLVITGLVGGVILVAFVALTGKAAFSESGWLGHILGILPGTGILFLVAVIGAIIYKSDEAMGMGDVKIFAPIGVFLGWKLCLVALILSIVSAGIISILLIVFRLKKRKDAIPFGPFIVAGTFLTIVWGTEILNWYIR